MDNIDVLLPLVSLLLLVALVGGGSFTNVAAENLTPMEYWQALLPETPMPPAIHDLLAQSAGLGSPDKRSVTEWQDVHAVKDIHIQRPDDMNIFAKTVRKMGAKFEGERRPRSDVKKYPFWYGRGSSKDLKYSDCYGSGSTEDPKKRPFWYGYGSTEDLKKYPFWYGMERTKDLKENDVKETSFFSGQGSTRNLMKYPFWYGHGHTEFKKNYPFWYGSEGNEDVKTFSVVHGSQNSEDLKKFPSWYDSRSGTKDLKKYPLWYGSRSATKNIERYPFWSRFGRPEDGLNKYPFWYGSRSGTKDLEKNPFWSRLGRSEDLAKVRVESEHDMDIGNKDEEIHKKKGNKDEDVLKISGPMPPGEEKMAITNGAPTKGDRVGTHKHGRNTPEGDIFFFNRDALRSGSVITPAFPPTTSLPALLPRRVADSIPFSTAHLGDILAMFAPESDAIAGEIHWTLEACERPEALLPGYRDAGCATSLESLAELAVALLGTRNVRAFSPDMAIDAAGTPARRGRHNVTAIRKLTESGQEMVTCHDMTYPYAVFFCHVASPAEAYAVTLASEDGMAPVMEALTVCHVDRSPVHGNEPGGAEVAACHFLTKLSVIWVPSTSEHVGAREV